MIRDTLTIPPHVKTTIEPRYARLLQKTGKAWEWMDATGVPYLHQLGRFPRTRRGQR